MRKNLSRLFFIILVSALTFSSCQNARNYLAPEGPKYAGKYARYPETFDDTLRVVTFNIQYAEKIDDAIKTIRNNTNLYDADILLLQEMDELGTEKISKELGYDYIYYPATVHPQSDKNFGNAILARWPITNTQKILLPYEFIINKTRRIAVAGTVSIKDLQLRIYSVHTATIVLSEEKRLAQADSVLKSIARNRSHIIVGGDFNTVFKKNVEDLDQIFYPSGFIRASRNAGSTIEKGPLEFTMDHIYTKGFQLIESGTVETEASDHNPVWVRLVTDKEQAQ